MFCKKCGQQINTAGKFCGYCGVEIKRENPSAKTKSCPFCKEEIYLDQGECPSCKRILIEKIPSSQKHATDTPKFYNQTEESIISKFIGLVRRINYSKLVFNKYILILFGVIFVVWIFSIYDSSYDNGGTKAPLPPPTTQISGDAVQFTPPTPAVSLTNGTIFKKNNTYLHGYGELQIKNGTSLDAVAKLIRGGASVLTVYMKANGVYTMLDISDGIYWLAFAQGLDWDSTTQKFRRDAQYSVFEKTFDFVTTEDSDSYYYPTFEVTLNPVIGGTAKTNSVDPQQFDAY